MKQRRYKGTLLSSQRTIIYVAMGGLILFNIIFFFIPLIWSIIGSFYKWNPLVGTMDFVGVSNYLKIFVSPIFKQSLKNTLFYAGVAVVLRTVLGLILAVSIVSISKGRDVIRSFYFLPVIMPIVAIAIVWKWIYHPRVGLMNFMLAMFGFVGPAWLSDINLAMPSIIVMTVWKDIGYAIIIYIAAYLAIPKVLYEAATLDGANERQKFFSLSIPLLRPITIFIVITSLISYFQSFVPIFIMTQGGPGNATNVLSYLLFNEAFKKYRFGYASALAVVLFIIIMIVTVIQFKILQKGGAK